MTIRILLADDQPLIRAGFRLILAGEPDIEVVGEATTGVEAVEQAQLTQPDVTLMDVRMPELDGIEATRQLCALRPEPTRVIVLTTFDVDAYVYEALRAGASGFLLKKAPPEELVRAIRLVAGGRALLDPAVTLRVIEEFAKTPSATPEPPAELATLTEREHEVLVLLADGLSNAELASRLFLSEATVKTHLSRMLAKLGLRDRVQAAIYAYEHAGGRPSR
ncbi:DNA-binding response regulator, NarL/FixJ family, contains REC and HTH domains [Amycolatopsis xylanica]|uniref:DNA-binding response regulator, NarL/FixJ family, contains REC and HTH domains n=1 Tax=Amycolatopsis xylanica TaxID=589385 RepID=A0A1H3CU86_9PSEU|nr:response regulator transcription factor [Amycolatopsis xylanica]SDX57468.1 DNA-binding response regulator, NarL/FixJ family, contains REC and HTH domains [Amycolatopsis xylanica]